jgi:HEAT repeat protein
MSTGTSRQSIEDMIAKLKAKRDRADIEDIQSLAEVSVSHSDIFVKLLESDDENLQIYAAQILAYHKKEENIEKLIEHFNNHNNSSLVRAFLASALSRVKDERAIDTLVKALNEDDETVKFHAVEALGKIGDAATIVILKKFLANLATTTGRMTREIRRKTKKSIETIQNRA